MYKRKFADDMLAAACKKAKISLPNITLNYKQAFKAAPITPSSSLSSSLSSASSSLSALIAPILLKKRKRSEECEIDTRNREARRIKSSHVGSNWTRYPPNLSPASKYQIFSNQTFSKIADNNNPTSPIKNAIKNAAKRAARGAARSTAEDTTTTTLPIRLAKPQRHSLASTNPLYKVQRNNKKQQTYKQGQQKQRNPKVPAQIQDSVSIPNPKYSSILMDWYAVELDHLDPII
ncbi:hypothetical protein ACQKWADRAFT_277782, partial [Trichoderma austrokoningii]